MNPFLLAYLVVLPVVGAWWLQRQIAASDVRYKNRLDLRDRLQAIQPQHDRRRSVPGNYEGPRRRKDDQPTTH